MVQMEKCVYVYVCKYSHTSIYLFYQFYSSRKPWFFLSQKQGNKEGKWSNWGFFFTLKVASPSFPPARPHLLKLITECHQLETKVFKYFSLWDIFSFKLQNVLCYELLQNKISRPTSEIQLSIAINDFMGLEVLW